MCYIRYLFLDGRQGSVAERYKALVYGSSLFGDVGSYPTPVNLLIFFIVIFHVLHKISLLQDKHSRVVERSKALV